MALSRALRNQVILRAGHRCEYCGLAQEGQEATFHIDHIVPVAEKGTSEMANLALACVSCSLKKGARLRVSDPATGQAVRFFHPREDAWNEHFRWNGAVLEGVTERGRATVHALELNRPLIVAIRGEETHWGRHPPPVS